MHNGGGELLPQALALQVDVAVRPTAEVDALEAASTQPPG